MEDYKSIVVVSGKKQVTVKENPTSYPLIGKGKQGAVFQLSPDKCVKIFAEENRCLNETKVLEAAQHARIVPKLFEVGPKYIVMEYIEGLSLDQYLESKGFLPEHITKKMINLLKEMKRLNFSRLDARLRHFLVNKNDELLVIDHANSFIKVDPLPTQLIKDLKEIGMLSAFLEQVEQLDPEFFGELSSLKKKDKQKKKDKREIH